MKRVPISDLYKTLLKIFKSKLLNTQDFDLKTRTEWLWQKVNSADLTVHSYLNTEG